MKIDKRWQSIAYMMLFVGKLYRTQTPDNCWWLPNESAAREYAFKHMVSPND